MALYVPDDDAAVSAAAGEYRRGRVAPCQGIGRRGIMAEENHVGLTRLGFVLVRGRLLQVDVPNVDFGKVRVRGDYPTVPRPALEAVDLSGMDENLAHLQSSLVALEALLSSRAISFDGHPALRKGAAGPRAKRREHVPLLRDVDLRNDEEGRLSASPLLILVPVVDAALVGPRAEVYFLPKALAVIQRFRTGSFFSRSREEVSSSGSREHGWAPAAAGDQVLGTKGPEKVIKIWLTAIPECLKALKKHLFKIKIVMIEERKRGGWH